MQEINELMPMFSYSLMAILFFLMLIIINIFLLRKPKEKKEEDIPKVIEPEVNKKELIKARYLKEIDLLKKQVENNEITSRIAYQRLSKIIRNFIFEMTSIKVQNYTLEEIKIIKMPVLTDLVTEYYDPEFAKFSNGNISISIDKTRQVIERWK